VVGGLLMNAGEVGSSAGWLIIVKADVTGL